jgi:predicted negative regulator of RcsB-dependent stress response
VTTHYEDEDQAERLKQWWKENWMALVGGAVIGLGAIFGWEGWKSYQEGRYAEASRMYEELKLAVEAGRSEDARSMGEALRKSHGRSPYAAGAEMFLASQAVQASEFDRAREHLRWVRENSRDEGMRQIARLREARVLWQQGEADAALALLDGRPGSFAALYEELRGDIRLAQGDRSGARAAYEKALAGVADDTPGARTELQRKLDDLTDVVKS